MTPTPKPPADLVEKLEKELELEEEYDIFMREAKMTAGKKASLEFAKGQIRRALSSPLLLSYMASREDVQAKCDEQLVEGLAKWHFEYSQSRCVNITHKFRFEEIDDKAKDEWREQARQALRQARGK